MKSIPKPASTVVLMNHNSKVYLTKRPKTMKVLAGYYVFPGGSVESEDSNIEINRIKNWENRESIHLTHYIAAARELFEEVGIFLGYKDDSSNMEFTNQTALEYRRQLINREITFSHILKQENLNLNFQHLTYFGHRVTPKISPIRFDTRFFLAKLPIGQTPIPELHEIDEAFWVNPKDALAFYDKGKIRLARPTIESLRAIINHQKGEELRLPAQQLV